jgi:hypothetical protein
MNDFLEIFEQIEQRASEGILRDIQKEIIQPFCDKYRLKFRSGTDGYNFSTRGGKDLLDFGVDYKVSDDGYFETTFIKRPYRKTQCGKELRKLGRVLELTYRTYYQLRSYKAILTEYDATQQSKGPA